MGVFTPPELANTLSQGLIDCFVDYLDLRPSKMILAYRIESDNRTANICYASYLLISNPCNNPPGWDYYPHSTDE